MAAGGSEPALNLGVFLEQLPPGVSPAVTGRRGIAGVPQCPCVLSPSTMLPPSGLLGPACWSLTGTGDRGLGGSRGERETDGQERRDAVSFDSSEPPGFWQWLEKSHSLSK